MPDYAQVLDGIAGGSLAASSLSSAAATTLDMPRLLHWETGAVRASWIVNPAYMNSRGVLFGGYYGVLADVILACTAMTVMEPQEHYITQDLHVAFYKPVRAGTIYFAGDVITRTQTRIACQCRFLDEQDRVLALASATQHVRRVE
jgi:uncharacterized protein (TIGR00369 family)